jgi:transketolase
MRNARNRKRGRVEALRERAARLREHSLRATSEAGSGHPSSCLSAADVVAALFFDVMRYDPKNPGNPDCDRFVLSKGHAAPLLYAAWAEAGAFPLQRLLTLRRFDSELEGHPTPRFSGTVAATGSLGQGLSVGVGVAWNARQVDRTDQRAYVLLGDGEMAEGSVWEAVEIAAYYRLENLTAIVDVNGLGQSQRTMHGFDVDTYAARFRSFGWHALTLEGNDMAAVVRAFDTARGLRGKPVALVAKTEKGSGVSFLANKDDWHGKPVKKGEQLDAALAEVRVGVTADTLPPPATYNGRRPAAKPRISKMAAPRYERGTEVATREAYGNALAKLGKVNPKLVVLDADTKNSTYAERFLDAHPGRYLEGFIAEQNMIGAAVGLSASGKVPFVSTFACFLTRGFDHIRMAAISRANLKMAGSHCGVSIGPDGPSQMGLEDIAMMRAVPDVDVLYPADAVATERLVETMSRKTGMQYIRLTRPKAPVLYDGKEEFPIGGSKIVRATKNDVATVIAAGITVSEALKAHEILAGEGIAIRILDAYSVKPIDRAGILAAAKATGGRIVVVEDHYFDGGLGDAVLNAVTGHDVAVTKLAVQGIPRSGQPEELMRAFGIDAEAIVGAIHTVAPRRGAKKAAASVRQRRR